MLCICVCLSISHCIGCLLLEVFGIFCMICDSLLLMSWCLVQLLKLYDGIFQIVKEGEEPEQFLNCLSHLSLGEMDVSSCG